MPTILFGERTDKTKDNKYGWNTLYDGRKENPEVREDTLLGKRSIICLPGDGSNSERDANAHCGAVQRMLTVAGVSKENMPHIYGIAYFESHTTDHRQKIIVNSGQNTLDTRPIKFSFQYYHPLFNKYLLPLIVHTNGQARSVEEIKKNLQNITFVSHCHGGFVAHQIEKMLADKIAEFYPDQQKQLMKNIRMIHFSSRRPIGHSSGAQHLDIISRNDSNYADSDMLERDNIHAQINRSKSGNNSALLSFSPEEKALVFKRLTTDKWGSRDHSEILDIFSREKENPIPENETGIHFIQSVLKKFVEHPTDQRDMESIFKEIDPIFTSESIACGQTLLAEEKENEKIHRGILSILASPFVRFGGILKGVTALNILLYEVIAFLITLSLLSTTSSISSLNSSIL